METIFLKCSETSVSGQNRPNHRNTVWVFYLATDSSLKSPVKLCFVKNMKKEKLTASFGSSYVLPSSIVQHFEGQLLTLVESWGLRETQEKAVKDLIREKLWSLMMNTALYLSPEEADEVVEKYRKYGTPAPLKGIS